MTPELFDTHCHLSFKGLVERCDDVVAEALREGVTRMITVACTPDEFETIGPLCGRYEGVWAAAGLHPHEAKHGSDAVLSCLAETWRHPSVVAAGEMGLDYHYDSSPRDAQRSVFAKQLQLARETELPIVVHTREAYDDTFQILTDEGYVGRRVVFHCFSGTPDQARELLEQGWHLSYTGVITFKNAVEPRQSCIETPIDRIMFETDAPYLTPEPMRKVRPNVPAYVAHTVRYAAEARGESFDALAKASTDNAIRFFSLR